MEIGSEQITINSDGGINNRYPENGKQFFFSLGKGNSDLPGTVRQNEGTRELSKN